MDIYSIDRDLDSEYRRLDKIPENERTQIIDFVNEIKITGITKYREYFYLVRIRMIYGILGDKFLNPDKKAIINMFLGLKKKYTDSTIMDYENVILDP